MFVALLNDMIYLPSACPAATMTDHISSEAISSLIKLKSDIYANYRPRPTRPNTTCTLKPEHRVSKH